MRITVPGSPEWISVGALADAFALDANVLPPVSSLSGSSLRMDLEDGRVAEIDFLAASELRWRLHDSPCAGRPEIASYTTTEIRPGVLFLTFLRPDRAAASASAVLDMAGGIGTIVLGDLPSRRDTEEPLVSRIERGAELTGVRADIQALSLNGPMKSATPRHPVTSELVGRHIEYTYSATERYEHIYLNERLYTWHCLEGSEKGLADTDRCHYRKIAGDLYLFVWCEKIVPTLGIVLVDLAKLKTTGQILGYRGFDFGAVTSFPIGARARILHESLRGMT